MTEIIQRKLNDSAFVRWTLILIALTMFFGYMFVDMMSPLQSMIEAQRGWTPDVFGMYGSSEFIFNVFGFLILAGIILDKMGIRFTGVLSASLMFIGASIKYYGVSDAFIGSGIETWLNSWWVSFPGSAKLASLGFMIFGCGMEMAGITVSKTIAKWFEGKEMALAMGLEMAIARVGVFAVFTISPWLANMAPATVVRPVAFCTLLLLIGLLTYVVFTFMDRKLDKQLGLDAKGNNSSEGVPRQRPRQNIRQQGLLDRRHALRALLLGDLPLPAFRPRTCWRATSASRPRRPPTSSAGSRWAPRPSRRCSAATSTIRAGALRC